MVVYDHSEGWGIERDCLNDPSERKVEGGVDEESKEKRWKDYFDHFSLLYGTRCGDN